MNDTEFLKELALVQSKSIEQGSENEFLDQFDELWEQVFKGSTTEEFEQRKAAMMRLLKLQNSFTEGWFEEMTERKKKELFEKADLLLSKEQDTPAGVTP